MSERERREQEGLAAEVEFAADLTDADRIRIFRDLLRTADANDKRPEAAKRTSMLRSSSAATLALPLLQAVAFSRHIHEFLHLAKGGLDDVVKVFADGAVAGGQGSFGQVPNE
jgi:hypothetical protein